MKIPEKFWNPGADMDHLRTKVDFTLSENKTPIHVMGLDLWSRYCKKKTTKV